MASLAIDFGTIDVSADTGRRLVASEPDAVAALAGAPAVPGRRPEPVSDRTARAASDLVRQHPDEVRPWERLGRYAFEHGDAVSAYAFFAAALRSSDAVLARLGYQPGDRLSWLVEANQPVIQASCGLGLAAKALGAQTEAGGLHHRTLVLVADSPR
ncbi:DUF3151 family protein [Streptomyces griseoruber]|uniref:DUF3151 family protein n=1 Tax=Streptomyces griseoruber TaxID=1943 RepID=UPI00379FD475